MKKIFYFLSVLFIISQFTATAQKSGIITYEMTVNIHAALPPAQQALKALIPKEKKSKVTVTFNKNYAKIEQVKEEESGGMIMMSMGDNDNPVYVDLKNKKRIDLLELEDNFYGSKTTMEILEEDAIEGKTKQILDYDCIAYEKDTAIEIATKTSSNTKNETTDGKKNAAEKTIIWVAPSLPKGLSPMGETFWNGTLMSFESELMKYEVINISFMPVADEMVKPEVDYREISEEQLFDLQEEKMEEMMKQFKQ